MAKDVRHRSERWKRAWRWATSAPGAMTLLLVAIILGSLFFLRSTDSPWERGLESLQEGQRATLRFYIVSGLWWGAVINCSLATVLLLLRGWWARPVQVDVETPQPCRHKALFLVLIGLALVVFVTNAWPRMSLSLWGDEEHNLRSSMMGEYARTETGEFEFKQQPWQRTFFVNINPNNHLLNSIVTRFILTIWQKVDGGKAPLFFNETVMRMPVFLAGCLGLVTVAGALWYLGLPSAAVVVSWLCALHPWYLRYATECRGYGLLLFFIPLVLLCAARAWRKPTFLNWLLFGFAQFLTLYAHASSLALLGCFNLFLGVGLLVREWRARRFQGWIPSPVVGRWLLGGTIGLMPFIQLYAPCYPQLLVYLKGSRAQAGTMDTAWLRDLLGFFTLGMPWHFQDPTNTIAVSIDRLMQENALLPFLSYGILIFGLLGLLRLVRYGPVTRAFALGSLLGFLGLFLPSFLANTYLYPWYLFAILGPFLICTGAGLSWLGEWVAGRWRAWPGFVLVVAVLALLAYETGPKRILLQKWPVEAQRESVLAARTQLGLGAVDRDQVITIMIRRGGSHMMTVPSYDPAAFYVENADELLEFMRRADAERLPLFVNLAMPSLARLPGNFPDIMGMLDDPQLYELSKQLPGIEPNVTRFVYRYKPGALRQHAR